jgi:hypothetical protein
MRRLLLTASVALAVASAAQPASAQLMFGAQAAAQTGLEVPTGGTTVAELDATYGVGARVLFSPPIPVLSLGLVGQGVYYFPDSGDSQTYGISAKVGIGLPLISPYLIGGWQWRRTDVDTTNGISAGAGVQLSVGVNLFLEATAEIGEDIPTGVQDYDNTALVIQAGVLFGG